MQCCTTLEQELLAEAETPAAHRLENIYEYDPAQFHPERYADLFLEHVNVHETGAGHYVASTYIAELPYELDGVPADDAFEILAEEFKILNVAEIAAVFIGNSSKRPNVSIVQFLRLARVLFYSEEYKQRPLLMFFYYCGIFNKHYASGNEMACVFQIAGEPRIEAKCSRYESVEVARFNRWTDKMWFGDPFKLKVVSFAETLPLASEGENDSFHHNFIDTLLSFEDTENQDLELFIYNVFGGLEESTANIFSTRTSLTEQ